jgi:alkylresorcinol/alkylpyrone synthase
VTYPAILALATGVPSNCYTQQEAADHFLHMVFQNGDRERAVRSIFNNAGVGSRYFAVDNSYYTQDWGTQERNERYFAEALPLGEETLRRCLDTAGLTAAAVDDLIVVSCTGFDIPGLDLRLAGRLGMRPDLRRTCILGMGCYAAFPALLRAREAAAQRPGRLALVLMLELCSLHLQFNEATENVVSSALFADGASAALIGQVEHQDLTPHLIDSATYCDYQTLDHMAFQLTNHGFRMYLSSYVPDLLAAKVEDFIDGLLERNSLSRKQIRFWGVHPGGSKILRHIQARLGLTDGEMEYSRAILFRYGNMSSATILFVLDEIQRCGQPQVGDYGVLMAFGPGLTMEAALIRW